MMAAGAGQIKDRSVEEVVQSDGGPLVDPCVARGGVKVEGDAPVLNAGEHCLSLGQSSGCWGAAHNHGLHLVLLLLIHHVLNQPAVPTQ